MRDCSIYCISLDYKILVLESVKTAVSGDTTTSVEAEHNFPKLCEHFT